jgi:hypothetical protein
MRNDHDHDFRPLPIGWYVTETDEDTGDTVLTPCPGLVRYQDIWGPTLAHVGGEAQRDDLPLVYRADLAHLPGELTIRVVGGVEHVRQSVPTNRRVLGPDTPFPSAKSEA